MLNQIKRENSEKSGPSEAEANHVVNLFNKGCFLEVEKISRTLVNKFENHSFGWKMLSVALYSMGRHGEALGYATKAVTLYPNDASAHYNIATIALELGDFSLSLLHSHKAIELKPDFLQAHHQLSRLHKYVHDDPLLKILENIMCQNQLNEVDSLALSAALAKAYEDIGDFERSFNALTLANSIQRKMTNYRITSAIKLFEKVVSDDARLPAIALTTPKSSTIPIFIVGMPRSGTTLVNQIITNNDYVASGGELIYLSEAYNHYCSAHKISADSITKVRAYYLKRIHKIAKGSRYLTDKTPNNFFFIGLIKRAFPEAIIIHVRRNARDVCWSNYKTIFNTGLVAYSNSLPDIVSYYQHYERLMQSFQERYPGYFYELSYDTLVNQFEDQCKSLFMHIGLT